MNFLGWSDNTERTINRNRMAHQYLNTGTYLFGSFMVGDKLFNHYSSWGSFFPRPVFIGIPLTMYFGSYFMTMYLEEPSKMISKPIADSNRNNESIRILTCRYPVTQVLSFTSTAIFMSFSSLIVREYIPTKLLEIISNGSNDLDIATGLFSAGLIHTWFYRESFPKTFAASSGLGILAMMGEAYLQNQSVFKGTLLYFLGISTILHLGADYMYKNNSSNALVGTLVAPASSMVSIYKYVRSYLLPSCEACKESNSCRFNFSDANEDHTD